MTQLLSIPASGLNTQSKRMAVSAQNVANLTSTGVRSEPVEPNDDGYIPQRVVATAAPGGGVRGDAVPISPAAVQVYDPGDPAADQQGLAPRPNVSLESEMVTQMQAKRAYQANLQSLKTMDRMIGALVDLAG